MMAKIKVSEIVIDFSGARAFVREVRSGGSNTAKGHRKAAEKYLDWLRKRYLAEGFGEWPALMQSTINRKRQNKEQILYEYGNLFNALTIRKSRENQYTVGIYSSQPARRSHKSLRQIATIHQQGRGIAKREIVVLPATNIYRSMVGFIQRGVDADVRKSNNASGRK